MIRYNYVLNEEQRDFISNMGIGSDFELPIYDTTIKKYISAQGIIPGSKKEPYKIGDFAIQADCTNAEFNIAPIILNGNGDFTRTFWSANLSSVFMNRVHIAINYTYNNILFKNRFKLMPRGSVIVSKLNNPNDWIFGCEPDFNAWLDGEQNEKPDVTKTNSKRLRTAATHFHFSHPIFKDRAEANRFARLFDVYVTLPFLFVDKDTRRRQLYGKAGAVRYTQYGDVPGVEIRTISSKALQSGKTMYNIMNNLFKVVQVFTNGYDTKDMFIPEIINNHDLGKAFKVMTHLNMG